MFSEKDLQQIMNQILVVMMITLFVLMMIQVTLPLALLGPCAPSAVSNLVMILSTALLIHVILIKAVTTLQIIFFVVLVKYAS